MPSKLRLLTLFQLANCYKLFKSPFELPDSVPQTCREALSRDIDCPFVVLADQVRNFDGLNSKVYDDPRALYCFNPCRSSLGDFLDNVVVACGDFKDDLWEDISETRSTMEFAESIIWARGLFCLKEKCVFDSLRRHTSLLTCGIGRTRRHTRLLILALYPIHSMHARERSTPSKRAIHASLFQRPCQWPLTG